MNLFVYDQTFEGLLTAISEAIELEIIPDKIVSTKSFQDDLFATKYDIMTDPEKFEHIWSKVKTKTNEPIQWSRYRFEPDDDCGQWEWQGAGAE